MTISTESRSDVFELAPPQEVANGGMLYDTSPAGVGILTYRRADGRVIREFVPWSTISDPAALQSMEQAAVTLGHPRAVSGEESIGSGARVTPDNYSRVAVGNVAGNVRADETNQRMYAQIVVRRRDALEAVQDGGYKYVSPQYRVGVDNTPGTYNGEPYDAIQVWRRYDSLAITDSPRGGSEAALRADEAHVLIDEQPSADEAPMDEAIEKLSGAVSAALERMDGMNSRLDELYARVDALGPDDDGASDEGADDGASDESASAEPDASHSDEGMDERLAKIEAGLARLMEKLADDDDDDDDGESDEASDGESDEDPDKGRSDEKPGTSAYTSKVQPAPEVGRSDSSDFEPRYLRGVASDDIAMRAMLDRKNKNKTKQ